MLDITTIILTYNEEIHIRRCLENVCAFSKKVFVVDSPSTDKTVDICKEFQNVEVVVHKYPGNQAEQFNWAIDNLQIDTEWILRIDADEYLLPELVDELETKLSTLPEDVKGIEFKRRHIFMGRWVKHGIYPIVLMRMFKRGYGRYDGRLMDEHITLSEGRSVVFDHDFCDHSLVSLSGFCRKHINYSEREAAEVLNEKYCLSQQKEFNLGSQAASKHRIKNRYNRLPLFWRAFVYFCYRYIFRGGFLDGKEGFLFAFFQGLWYRTLVDAKIYEAKKACGKDPDKLRQYIKDQWNISI